MSKRAIKARVTLEVTISHSSLTIESANRELSKLTDKLKHTSLPYSMGTPLVSLDSIESKLVNEQLHPEIPAK